MVIEQFYDTGLAHASYAIINDSKAVIIDPSRNPEQYYEFCKKHNATIIAVIETHPHADFISGHLEISTKNGVPIYLSKLIQPEFDFIGFDDGDSIALGNVTLKSINTPGHSPDSICIVLIDENGVEHSVFTGDTLFIGDVGRPDLRESA
jgi:hydroxyacylglutathione hydrolase